eukprot:scaffold8034_cov101-Isochrysis_galbana.AAC.1
MEKTADATHINHQSSIIDRPHHGGVIHQRLPPSPHCPSNPFRRYHPPNDPRRCGPPGESHQPRTPHRYPPDPGNAWDRKSSQGRSGASRQHIPDDASPPPMPSLKSSVPATEGLAAAVTALAGGLAAGLSLGSAGAAVPHLLSPLEVRSPAPLARLLLCLRTARGARRGTRVACTMRLARVRSVTGRPINGPERACVTHNSAAADAQPAAGRPHRRWRSPLPSPGRLPANFVISTRADARRSCAQRAAPVFTPRHV